MNVLLQALVEGYGRPGRGRPAGGFATPAKHLPIAKPFTAGEYDELVAAMGGVTVVKTVGMP